MANSDFTAHTNPAHNFLNLTGRRFGRLIALEPLKHITQERLFWRCACDCGGEIRTLSTSLLTGRTKSCGCWRNEYPGPVKHGLSGTPTYVTWVGIKNRCKNKNEFSYRHYGGRGITYDPRWEKFENFLADMGERPVGTEIDRINNDGNYYKDNCRWVTAQINQNNKRTNSVIEYNGKRMTMSNLAREVGMRPATLFARIYAGFSLEQAVTTHHQTERTTKMVNFYGRAITINELARESGVLAATLTDRIRRQGMTPEQAVIAPYRTWRRDVQRT